MRTIVTLSLLALLIASAASAAKFVPEPEPRSERARSPRPAVAIAQAKKSTVEARQAPVPLQWAYKHETLDVPDEKSPSIADLANKALTEQSSAPGGYGRDAARAAIEADGYKSVRGLVKGDDGSWRGRAMRGRTEVAIRVNPDGSVSAD